MSISVDVKRMIINNLEENKEERNKSLEKLEGIRDNYS